MAEERKIPDWNVLMSFGLPLNRRDADGSVPDYDAVIDNIILASRYLEDNQNHTGRYYDSFRALLLSLKIHYPTEYRRIEHMAGLNFIESFDLTNITGRDIKLRNISLGFISSYYRGLCG